MSLNHAQTEAVAHNEGPCMVLAGPGSGKTLTIAKRIEYLITKYKVRPEEILVITFTKYAAQEMKERTRRICGPSSYAVTYIRNVSRNLLRNPEMGVPSGTIESPYG